MSNPLPDSIPALLARNTPGHQFVCYADSCSGVPGALHESTFAAVNNVVARLDPQPEFICFPGDEISGLTADADELRRQWDHWFSQELDWLDRRAIPMYHTTGNHTAYDPTSEAIYQEVMSHLPDNGPPGQERLSYYVRRDDLLIVFVNTMSTSLGGEGRVETGWLAQTLAAHSDARHKLVAGHHPVFPVNGFSGSYQREIAPENGKTFWKTLVEHQVLAYLCSHILAFDVQVHDGVLQILTAGAGTAHRMPEGIEYLHCLQGALDSSGLRYQVLDTDGRIREWLEWPLQLPASAGWLPLSPGEQESPIGPVMERDGRQAHLVAWRFAGISPATEDGQAQTLVSGWDPGPALAPLWIGLLGQENRLSVLLAPAAGRSPHHWHGPPLPPGEAFEIQLAIHSGMGPGGLLWRWNDETPWSSLSAASPWGGERLAWPERWSVSFAQRGPSDRPFRGRSLQAWWHAQQIQLASGGRLR